MKDYSTEPLWIAALAAWLIAGCSGGASKAPDAGKSASSTKDSGSQDRPRSDQDAGKPPAVEIKDGGSGDAKDASAVVKDAGSGAIDSGGLEQDAAPALVELPDGSRELDGVVNLVDAPAAAELESFILDMTQPPPVPQQHGLTLPTNLFLAHYTEDYDFLYFITDHVLSGGTTIGRFEAVNYAAAPGGTSEFEVQAAGYTTTGRLKGVVGFRYRPMIFPPLAHETLHYWANYLDRRFGFGPALDQDYGTHWGMGSVHGLLGGFDSTTLRCETPAGAMPPGCTALSGGRFRYVVGAFFPNDNTGFGIPYAPLELYLMGLVPASRVDTSFKVLTRAALDESTRGVDTVVVEADGIADVTFASIVDRHGSITPLAADKRHFRAAFVVVSAQPAPDDVLAEVARWAAVFGARQDVSGWPSFETTAGGLATMDTLLGPRRRVSDAPPAAKGVLGCDVLAQDCPRPELGCYELFPPLCALSGGVALDKSCSARFACAPGLECTSGQTPDAYVCKPYCDPNDSSSDRSCQKLCPGQFITFQTKQGQTVSAACTPP